MKLSQVFDLMKRSSFLQMFKIKKFHDTTVMYARNYMATYCLCALLNVGLLEELDKKRSVDLAEFVSRKGLNLRLMQAVADYLYVLKLLNKCGAGYCLSSAGRKILDYGSGTLNFIYGYAPLFENLDDLLKGKKKYNKDVFRRDRWMAKGTAEVSQFIPIPVVKNLIQKYGFARVLDLGCGSCDFLTQLCEGTSLKALGIDISVEGLKYAQELIDQKGLSEQIKVKQVDIFDTAKLQQISKDIDVITSMFVIHEFIPQGEDVVVKLLKGIRSSFPDTHFIICELSKTDPDRLRRRPTSIAEHHLFHALSSQGLYTPEQWHTVFAKAGYHLVEERRYDFAGQAYFIVK